MGCDFCKAIINNFNLSSTDFAEVTDDKFAEFFGEHPYLIHYADFGNGVSDAGYGMMCTSCKTFVDVDFVMYTDKRYITLKSEIDADDIEQAAHMWALMQRCTCLQESIKRTGSKRYYFVSDLYVPHVFGEMTMKPFEILQRFGMNHTTYSTYDRLYTSLEETVRNCGTNDVYSKKTFICCTELEGNTIDVQSHPNPYEDATITMTSQVPIPPTQIIYIDLMAKTEMPLSNVALSECENRDHDDYLAYIRSLQQELPNADTTEFDLAVERAIKEIKQTVITSK